jgi:hypothetical protein
LIIVFEDPTFGLHAFNWRPTNNCTYVLGFSNLDLIMVKLVSSILVVPVLLRSNPSRKSTHGDYWAFGLPLLVPSQCLSFHIHHGCHRAPILTETKAAIWTEWFPYFCFPSSPLLSYLSLDTVFCFFLILWK